VKTRGRNFCEGALAETGKGDVLSITEKRELERGGVPARRETT